MRLTRYLASKETLRYWYKILVEEPPRKCPCERGRITDNIKWILEKECLNAWNGFHYMIKRLPLVNIVLNGEKFLDQQCDYQLFRDCDSLTEIVTAVKIMKIFFWV
jgi:hypothetical protein